MGSIAGLAKNLSTKNVPVVKLTLRQLGVRLEHAALIINMLVALIAKVLASRWLVKNLITFSQNFLPLFLSQIEMLVSPG